MKNIRVCAQCGSSYVQLQFPIWIDATSLKVDEREVDWEAEPERWSDTTFCLRCNDRTGIREVLITDLKEPTNAHQAGS